jgi:hypothetical protein
VSPFLACIGSPCLRQCVHGAPIPIGIFAMAVGSFFFGMLVGSLSAHITSGNIADQEHRTKMETVREFMRTHEVSQAPALYDALMRRRARHVPATAPQ